MFKPVKEDDTDSGKHNMRTRRTCVGIKGRKRVSTPDNLDSPSESTSSKDTGRKSPSTLSTCSNSSTDRETKKKVSDSKPRKRNAESESDDNKPIKKKDKSQDRSDSPIDSSTESSISGKDDDEVGNEGDIENNQDDLSSSSSNTSSPVENNTEIDLKAPPRIQSTIQPPTDIKPIPVKPEISPPPLAPITRDPTLLLSGAPKPVLVPGAPIRPPELIHSVPPIPPLASHPPSQITSTATSGPTTVTTPSKTPPPHSVPMPSQVTLPPQGPPPLTPQIPPLPHPHLPPHPMSMSQLPLSVPLPIQAGPVPGMIKQEPISPPQSRPSHLHTNSKPPSPMKPRSPSAPRSPSRQRSRSRSPVREEASSPEPDDYPRGPSPEPRIVNEKCHASKNALFVKHLWRGYNTCSRCDFHFKPMPDSKLAKKREERARRASQGSMPAPASSAPQTPVSPHPVKEERKEEKREDIRDKSLIQKATATPPANTTADAQITSSLMPTQTHVSPYSERLTPGRPPGFPPVGHDPTPALRTLSEYARPHTLETSDPIQMQRLREAARLHQLEALGQDPPRSLPYNLPGMPPHMDPLLHYRMAGLPPHGTSRERLELELERDKRERDHRERELREMEYRDKIKQEIEMKPPGFDRLPPGANPLDPHWAEIQRRYGGMPPGTPGPHPHGSHIPGVYPPASLASDLVQRERERIERLDALRHHQQQTSSNPNNSVGSELTVYQLYQRNSLDPVLMQRLAQSYPSLAAAKASQQDHDQRMVESMHLVYHYSRADPLAAAAAAAVGSASQHPSSHPLSSLPPGHPMLVAREQELLYRDLLSRPPYSTDPVLAHQLTLQAASQHEALQRQIALERERLGPHLPH